MPASLLVSEGGSNGRWRWRAGNRALNNESASIVIQLLGPQPKLVPSGDVTVEGWVRPTGVSGRILSVNQGSIEGRFFPSTVLSLLPVSGRTDALAVAFGSGGSRVRTGGTVPWGKWSHVAGSVRMAGGLAFNVDSPAGAPVQYAVLSASDSDLFVGSSSQLTFWLQVDDFASASRALIGVWGPTEDERSFRMTIGSGNHVTLDAYVDIPTFRTVTINKEKVSVPSGHVRKRFTLQSRTQVLTKIPHQVVARIYADPPAPDGATTWSLGLTIGTSSVLQKPDTIALGTFPEGGIPELADVNRPTTLAVAGWDVANGRPATEPGVGPFRGVIAGLKAWAGTPEIEASADPPGAIASWSFSERAGTAALDDEGERVLRLSSDELWRPFPLLSDVSIFVNGLRQNLAALTFPDSKDQETLPDYGNGTFASYLGSAGFEAVTTRTPSSPLVGQLQEVRYWRVVRTRPQIEAGMHRPVEAYQPGLTAYWPLHELHGSNVPSMVSPELSMSAVSGDLEYVDTNAPVGSEAPEVDITYADRPTDGATGQGVVSIQGSTAALEYAQVDVVDGVPAADFRRAHLAVKVAEGERSSMATSGYVVGEVEAVYLGQGQLAPTLTGFIEGAPPVPSEDLNMGWWQSTVSQANYAGVTSVLLGEESSTTQRAEVEQTRTYQGHMAVKVTPLAVAWGFRPAVPFPLWINTPAGALEQSVAMNVGTKMGGGTEQADKSSYESSWNVTTNHRSFLTGRWELEARYPEFGRRFLPYSIGQAFVLTATTDVYSLQLRGSGHMVGKVSLLSRDVPVDHAIIEFPMRQGYVKNGVLDGQVGYNLDPDFSDLPVHERSYFRPRQAYRMKDRLQRQEQAIRSKLATWDAVNYGKWGQPVRMYGAPDEPPVAGQQAYDWQDERSRQGIVNSYYWQVSGLRQETEEVGAKRTVELSGGYDFTVEGGAGFVYKHQFGVFGYDSTVDFTASTAVKLRAKHTEERSQKLGLTLTNDIQRLLDVFEPIGDTWRGAPAPGQVTGYRTLAFYLPPDVQNGRDFDEVVDPVWLASSNDAAAVALRRARTSGPGVTPFRVLYRVTYVERVAKGAPDAAEIATSAEPLQPVDLVGSVLLATIIQDLLPPGAEPNLAALAAAVDSATSIPAPATAPLAELIPWWRDLTTLAGQPGPEGLAAKAYIEQLRLDMLDWFTRAYESGQLPIQTQTGARARSVPPAGGEPASP